MKKLGLSLLALSCTLWLAAGIALAQSSGNFTYGDTGGTHCVLSKSNGAITGGAICSSGTDCTANGCTPIPSTSGNVCAGTISAGIKTSSGAGNVFDIRPSAVIGLLTDVSLQKNSTLDVGTSTAYAGVDFDVEVTPGSGQPAPTVTPDFPVTYAARFVEISSNLFDVLGSTCTTVGTNSLGGTVTAQGCYITFDESTVSAHSFDWIASNLSSGTYGIAANWKASLGNTGISEALTCVGPVNLTVEQNKVFSFNTVN